MLVKSGLIGAVCSPHRHFISLTSRAQTTDVLSRELESVAEGDLMLPPEVPEPADRERTPEPVPIPPAPPSPETREQVSSRPNQLKS